MESILGGLPESHIIYEMIEHAGDLDGIPKKIDTTELQEGSRKKVKRNENDF